MRSHRILAVLSCLFCIFTAQMAHADFADSLLNRLKSLPTGIDPNQIELARYTIQHPQNAEVVYARAAAQDYPFFALMGAVKVAKGRTFPKIGVFTQEKCLLPITAIDEVFARASDTIDDAKGKADTTTAIGVAKTYAANYAKAQTDEVRQQLIADLAKNVPYFQDIPVICSFAFETDFKAERNFNALIQQTAKDIREAYTAFKSGNIVFGVEKLVTAGMDPKLACDLVDQGLAGGLIGKTPLVGSLAKGACKSFAGTVIKGIASTAGKIVKAGEKAAEAAVCAVETLWGGCEEGTPPPPTGYSEAKNFCATRGGLRLLSSLTNQPNDYDVVCTDNSQCSIHPGKKPQCASGAQIAAHKAEMLALAASGYAAGVAIWTSHFDATWLDKCSDQQCDTGMKAVRFAALKEAQKAHEQTPDEQWFMIAALLHLNYETAADKLLAEDKARFAAKNASITNNAAEGWEQIVIAKWSKDCLDQICIDEVKKAAIQMHAEMVALQKAQPDASARSVQGQIGKKYGPIYQALVDLSKKRAALKDPDATPAQKLQAMNCKNFLGRADQYMCDGAFGFGACVQYVKQQKAQLCISQVNGIFADEPTATKMLASQGCQRQGTTGLVFKCTPGQQGAATCAKYKATGMAMTCL